MGFFLIETAALKFHATQYNNTAKNQRLCLSKFMDNTSSQFICATSACECVRVCESAHVLVSRGC